jgi:hypothetical protein
MKQNQFKTITMLLYGMVIVSFASCIDGYKGNEVWTSSVRNAQLESPAANQITVTFSADGATQTVNWPLVSGAGGYSVSVYNMDDPDNPKIIGEENQVVDGVSVSRPSAEDTRYKVVIKTLGNPTNNNKEAEAATEKLYDNMLPVTAVIPNGTDLAEYFTNNPIPASSTELCYELEAGGNYTMSGSVFQGMTAVTIRGDKVDHANLAMINGSFVNNGAGFKLKFMDINYSGFTGTSSNAIILMNSTFNAAGVTLSDGGYVVLPTTAPIALQSCKFKGLLYYLFYDAGQKYAIGTFLIKDCVIGQNTNSFGNALIRLATGMIKDFTITNSTIYNEVAPSNSGNRFMQISTGNVTSVKPLTETWANGSLTITNCTFWQVGKTAQSFNSNGAMGLAGDRITIQKNVFVDSYENGRIISRFRRGVITAAYFGGQNSQWYDGQCSYNVSGAQDAGSSAPDVAYISSDPHVTYSGNGVFKMTGAEQIAARTGDPRWLPAQ